MAKVTDHIWIGSENDSDNKQFLEQNKIDVVLNVANDYPFEYSHRYPAHYGIMLIDYEYPDDDEYDILMQNLNKAINLINEIVRQKKNILVHCHMGVNRAPFVIGKYLIEFQKYNGLGALELLKKANQSRGQKETLSSLLLKSFFI